jgi:23S rRNA (cytosine1962-C5)-methyltransferase
LKLRLRRDVVRTIRSGHPWIYAEALVPPPSLLPAGAVVEVLDFSSRFLARGLWDPSSPIAVRVYTRDQDEALDETLVRDRILAAAERRAGLLADHSTDACRLVHGEADLLPGIVCDRYADAAVLRFDGDAAATLRPWAVAAVAALPGIRTVLERPFGRASSRSRTGADADVDPNPVVLHGRLADETLVVREHGLRFEVDLLRGHKTGLYLDQRENRALVRERADGRRLLNLFAYAGGFTVAAIAGGAAESLSIDISRPALDAARRNLALNDIDPAAHDFHAGDVFEWLASSAASRRSFDLLVIDPPSFAPNHAAVPRALGAYRRLNAAALRLAAPGALVLTCSCSSHVGEAQFKEAVLCAVSDARRKLRIVDSFGPSLDHPVARWFPEGRYLKSLLLS